MQNWYGFRRNAVPPLGGAWTLRWSRPAGVRGRPRRSKLLCCAARLTRPQPQLGNCHLRRRPGRWNLLGPRPGRGRQANQRATATTSDGRSRARSHRTRTRRRGAVKPRPAASACVTVTNRTAQTQPQPPYGLLQRSVSVAPEGTYAFLSCGNARL